MTRHILWSTAIAFVIAASVSAQSVSPAGGTSGLVGIWSLDKNLSDRNDPGDRDSRGPGGMGGPGGGMGGPGGGIGGPGGGMGGPGGMGPMGGFGNRRGNRDDARRSSRILQDLSKPPEGLTIVKDGVLVMITTSEGRTVKLSADGKEQERLSGDGVIKSKTRWQGERLTVEEKIQDGPTVTRTYLVSADGAQLILIVRIEADGIPGPAVLHHVYGRKD